VPGPCFGPGGCGQEQHCGLISGLDFPTGPRPARGRARHHALPRRRAGWRWVFRSYALIPPERGPRTSLGGGSATSDATTIAATSMRARAAAARVSWQRRRRNLSGGQRQRGGPGRWALLRRPQVFCSMNRCSNSTPRCRESCGPSFAPRSSAAVGGAGGLLPMTRRQKPWGIAVAIACARARRPQQCGHGSASSTTDPPTLFVGPVHRSAPDNVLKNRCSLWPCGPTLHLLVREGGLNEFGW